MKRKTIWIISVLLVIGATVYFGLHRTDSGQVAGASIKILPVDRNSLIMPPKRTAIYQEASIKSKASVLIDSKSAYVLHDENADLKVPIASTTKIMTATVVLDDYGEHLDDVVTITKPMINIEGSKIQLKVGEKIKVRDLLKGLLIASGNDTAYALALHFGGKEAFVKEMNDKAAFLGLSSTHYRCPAGLDDEGYSTAKDLALLANYALKNQIFSKIVSTPKETVVSTDGATTHELENSNRMLQEDEFNYYPYSVGVKTGFTYAAGHCLVSSAVKDGHQLVGVVLNTNEYTVTASATESKKLLSWGFANWEWD